MAHLFISYSRKNADFVNHISQLLKTHGVDLWIDQDDIPAGERWSRAVEKGLAESLVMLLVISPESMKSDHVEDEWAYFLDHKKPIIPILLRATDLPFRLRNLQYIDFSKGSLTTPMRDLLKTLRDCLSRHGIVVKDYSDPRRYDSLREMDDIKANLDFWNTIREAFANFSFVSKSTNSGRVITELGFFVQSVGAFRFEVYLEHEDFERYSAQVLCPILRITEQTLKQPLFERLLRLNLLMDTIALGVTSDEVYLYYSHRMDVYPPESFWPILKLMIEYAQNMPPQLAKEFDCELILRSESDSNLSDTSLS